VFHVEFDNAALDVLDIVHDGGSKRVFQRGGAVLYRKRAPWAGAVPTMFLTACNTVASRCIV
jgi:hypothetical protein